MRIDKFILKQAEYTLCGAYIVRNKFLSEIHGRFIILINSQALYISHIKQFY